MTQTENHKKLFTKTKQKYCSVKKTYTETIKAQGKKQAPVYYVNDGKQEQKTQQNVPDHSVQTSKVVQSNRSSPKPQCQQITKTPIRDWEDFFDPMKSCVVINVHVRM